MGEPRKAERSSPRIAQRSRSQLGFFWVWEEGGGRAGYGVGQLGVQEFRFGESLMVQKFGDSVTASLSLRAKSSKSRLDLGFRL